MFDIFLFSLVMGMRTTPTTKTISPMDSRAGPRKFVTFVQWSAKYRPLMMIPHARKLPPVDMRWMGNQKTSHLLRDVSVVQRDSLRDRLNTVLSVRLWGVSWSLDWERVHSPRGMFSGLPGMASWVTLWECESIFEAEGRVERVENTIKSKLSAQ